MSCNPRRFLKMPLYFCLPLSLPTIRYPTPYTGKYKGLAYSIFSKTFKQSLCFPFDDSGLKRLIYRYSQWLRFVSHVAARLVQLFLESKIDTHWGEFATYISVQLTNAVGLYYTTRYMLVSNTFTDLIKVQSFIYAVQMCP